ncbi:MAG TPA: type VI secretion system protein TssA [Bryobacteraceae bacterium]|jgi:type VI secretion system protein ImpA|nr:type VI secretion system protein TssA [Bryobacteraceae bacterium]
MPLRADLLTPVAGDNPSGANLRYDPVIDKIKEARREDIDAPQGAWKTTVKTADYGAVIKLAGEVIATRSKDLQLAVWLVEAHIRREGLPVAGACFKFIHQLLEHFWDTLYPELEDGDVELRAGPLEWLGQKLDLPVRQAPITASGYSYLAYKESRIIGYEADAQGSYEKLEIRNARIAEGKLTAEQFDEAVDATPMGFYGSALGSVNDAMTEIQSLLAFCDERMGDEAPGFTTTRKALEDVAQLLELFLRKKGGAVEVPSAADDDATDFGLDDVSFSFAAPPPPITTDNGASADTQTATAVATAEAYAEPQSEADVVTQIVAIAKYLRNADAQDVSPYLITRAYHWGKLRNGAPPVRQDALEPPPTELRMKLKKLFLSNDWGSLLTEVEDSLGLPCAGPWLDLHRYAVLALEQQGMTPIAGAIKTELRGVLQDLPDLQAATLLDDTPAANAETQTWLNAEIAAKAGEAASGVDTTFDLSVSLDEPAAPDTSSDTSFDLSISEDTTAAPEPDAETTTEAPAELTTFDFPGLDENPPIVAVVEPEPDMAPEDQDVFDVAVKTLKDGDAAGGLRLLTDKLATERSNRGRFRRRTQIAHLLLSGGRPKVARPLLDQLASEIEERKLDEWEDGSVVAYPLELLLRCLSADPAQEERKTELYTRLCRLDPVRAMAISN